ncbi:hypothetical protein SERLADRAFT_400186 [Serpula lacrymans var. lacrymans S7.9]|uniref:Uncharacterized protein n=1 Tax=Serpula lacrymans var. lacrymans (strain S7.9) TaxID=578457 RepID=F8P900_SERL9|nr:uncharacterized protein SERLADRAFT_400186 [Serpula lacrymans var. lacrymans S7.9]EGO20129.1 hypothetical protein SERLADRAFT_400186 [Serpula lacrymans var. lacrymans S7.9]
MSACMSRLASTGPTSYLINNTPLIPLANNSPCHKARSRERGKNQGRDHDSPSHLY